jgi:hypothetical protein
VVEFADYLVEAAAHYPETRTVRLVRDRLHTHRRKLLVKRYGEKLGGLLWHRFTIHDTPKHPPDTALLNHTGAVLVSSL